MRKIKISDSSCKFNISPGEWLLIVSPCINIKIGGGIATANRLFFRTRNEMYKSKKSLKAQGYMVIHKYLKKQGDIYENYKFRIRKFREVQQTHNQFTIQN